MVLEFILQDLVGHLLSGYRYWGPLRLCSKCRILGVKRFVKNPTLDEIWSEMMGGLSNTISKRRNELKQTEFFFKIHVIVKSNHTVDTEMLLLLVNGSSTVDVMKVYNWCSSCGQCLKTSVFWISGRSLSNSVINLGIQDQYTEALSQLGFEFEVLAEQVIFTFNLNLLYFQFTVVTISSQSNCGGYYICNVHVC